MSFLYTYIYLDKFLKLKKLRKLNSQNHLLVGLSQLVEWLEIFVFISHQHLQLLYVFLSQLVPWLHYQLSRIANASCGWQGFLYAFFFFCCLFKPPGQFIEGGLSHHNLTYHHELMTILLPTEYNYQEMEKEFFKA